MSGFGTLIGFEYRKILKRKSVVIALLFSLTLSILSAMGTLLGSYYIEGKIYESNYDAMIRDRDYARSLAGRALDTDLLLEAAAAYATIPEDAEVYQATEEYQQNARRYGEIYALTQKVFTNDTQHFSAKDMANLTQVQADQFYAMRMEQIRQRIQDTLMSDKAKETILQWAAQTEVPIKFSYVGGYARVLTILYTTGVIAAFVMAICIAPLFAGEYTAGADQLILASKYGKNKLIAAKLFTGFSFAGILSLILTLQCYIECMLLFGADGRDIPVQIASPFCVYPFSFGQVVLLQGLCIFLACIMTAGFAMFLSAKLKTPFGVIVLVSLVLMVPMLISVPEKPLLPYQLIGLLPTNMMPIWRVWDDIAYELFGLVIPAFIVLPVFAVCCTAVFTPFAYKFFQKHQIS